MSMFDLQQSIGKIITPAIAGEKNKEVETSINDFRTVSKFLQQTLPSDKGKRSQEVKLTEINSEAFKNHAERNNFWKNFKTRFGDKLTFDIDLEVEGEKFTSTQGTIDSDKNFSTTKTLQELNKDFQKWVSKKGLNGENFSLLNRRDANTLAHPSDELSKGISNFTATINPITKNKTKNNTSKIFIATIITGLIILWYLIK